MPVKPLVRLHLRRRDQGGRLISKSRRRELMGWLKPIRCPRCRQFTRQVKAGGSVVVGIRRRCLGCGSVFTRVQARAAQKAQQRAA